MFYGLDLHWRFIQVCCIDGGGQKQKEFRVDVTREAIAAFAERLGPGDAVVMEATFHTWVVWSLLAPRAGRVVVANPLQVKAIAHARVKTDKVDAHILAQLLRLDFIPAVEMPSTQTWELRQLVTHRQLLARKRTAVRNAIHGILHRKLLRCPHCEPFSAVGRRWLLAQDYTETERLMLDSDLALLDQLERGLETVDARLRAAAAAEQDVRLLMTIPGVGTTVAVGLLAAIGDIARFATPEKLAAYFGLVPSISQSGDQCHHGRITKQGRSSARWLAVEAAQSLSQNSTPLAATYHRVKRKRGHNVAVTALARKLVVLVWHVLRNQEPYRYGPVAHTRRKLRQVTPGLAPAHPGRVPHTLEAVYEEVGLPVPSAPRVAEKRTASVNLSTVTLARKARVCDMTVKSHKSLARARS
ncbi:MAG: IS110 family transposase [Deltaproteobacteria bacterium]|nr:IS110 family transposase [Deltaproteobacteria bacterium]